MRDFRELQVWHKTHQLTLASYKATASFPQSELFGLTSQIRRAATSIEANIAEGCGRHGDAELSRFLQIAMGSASELECHFLIARDLGFMNQATHEKLSSQTTEAKRMLASFLKKLRADR
jgi:four helix bundle protein